MVWRAVLRDWDTTPPPPPRWPPTPTIASSPHRAVAPNPVLPPSAHGAPPPPTVDSYWRSQPLAGRLRAIRPTLNGYVFRFFYRKLSMFIFGMFGNSVQINSTIFNILLIRSLKFLSKQWILCFFLPFIYILRTL